MNALLERRRKAEAAVDRERGQATAAGVGTAISAVTAGLAWLLGGKTTSATVGRAATAARGATRTYQQSQDVSRATENIQAIDQQIADLNAVIDEEKSRVAAQYNPLTEELETIALKPKKTNISVRTVVLAWAPYWQTPDGLLTEAFR
jgi:hypothetical protein